MREKDQKKGWKIRIEEGKKSQKGVKEMKL